MKRPLLKSPTTGIYHITVRGNNREFIFQTHQSKRKYIRIIKESKEHFDFELYSWVIMSNHVHLLLKVNNTPLPKIMHELQLRYSKWYNCKYNHSGHVFEGPYKMLECLSHEYFLNIIRYIHQNPERSKLDLTQNYNWSSHQDYMLAPRWGITDTKLSLALINSDTRKAYSYYNQFIVSPETTIPELNHEDLYATPPITSRSTALTQ